jgi:hypothetical protein
LSTATSKFTGPENRKSANINNFLRQQMEMNFGLLLYFSMVLVYVKSGVDMNLFEIQIVSSKAAHRPNTE